MSKDLKIFSFILVLILCMGTPALAAGDSVEPPKQDWSFNGMTGTFDKAALQRGLKIYREVCSACHGLKRIAFRELEALGYTEDQIKNIASEYTIMDGPDDEGEMFERAGLPSDRFPSPFPNEQAARAANNNAYPLDLSLITKARHGGADYIHALLTGYEEPHGDVKLLAGQYWNKYMPGHVISMAPPLSAGMVAYEDGTPETLEQYAKDIAHFLTWASSPYLETQKATGIKTLIFLLIFAGVMYAVKRKIWSDVH